MRWPAKALDETRGRADESQRSPKGVSDESWFGRIVTSALWLALALWVATSEWLWFERLDL